MRTVRIYSSRIVIQFWLNGLEILFHGRFPIFILLSNVRKGPNGWKRTKEQGDVSLRVDRDYFLNYTNFPPACGELPLSLVMLLNSTLLVRKFLFIAT